MTQYQIEESVDGKFRVQCSRNGIDWSGLNANNMRVEQFMLGDQKSYPTLAKANKAALAFIKQDNGGRKYHKVTP